MKDTVVIYIFIVHGIIEAFLMSFLIGVASLIEPKINLGLVPDIGISDEYFIRSASPLYIFTGLVVFRYAIEASIYHQNYRDFKFMARVLCLSDIAYTTLQLCYIPEYGWIMLVPAGLDIYLFISKVILFWFNVADKHYDYNLIEK